MSYRKPKSNSFIKVDRDLISSQIKRCEENIERIVVAIEQFSEVLKCILFNEGKKSCVIQYANANTPQPGERTINPDKNPETPLKCEACCTNEDEESGEHASAEGVDSTNLSSTLIELDGNSSDKTIVSYEDCADIKVMEEFQKDIDKDLSHEIKLEQEQSFKDLKESSQIENNRNATPSAVLEEEEKKLNEIQEKLHELRHAVCKIYKNCCKFEKYFARIDKDLESMNERLNKFTNIEMLEQRKRVSTKRENVGNDAQTTVECGSSNGFVLNTCQSEEFK